MERKTVFVIAQTRFFYSGHPWKGYVADDCGCLLILNTKREAAEAVKNLDEKVYRLSHGEYARPKYKARRIPKERVKEIRNLCC